MALFQLEKRNGAAVPIDSPPSPKSRSVLNADYEKKMQDFLIPTRPIGQHWNYLALNLRLNVIPTKALDKVRERERFPHYSFPSKLSPLCTTGDKCELSLKAKKNLQECLSSLQTEK